MAKDLKRRFVFLYLLVSFILINSSVLAGNIYIDTLSSGIPAISGDVWPDSNAVWDANKNAWYLTLHVTGAHRQWPPITKAVLTDPLTGEPSMAFALYLVDWSELMWWSYYRCYLYGLDQSGYNIPINISWAEGTYNSAVNDGNWALAITSLITNLETYNIYLRGTGDVIYDTDDFIDLGGLVVPHENEILLQQYDQEEFTVKLFNSGDTAISIYWDVINVHATLSFESTSDSPLSVEPGTIVEIPVTLLTNDANVGLYDDILMVFTTENGSALYSNINVVVVEQGTEPRPDLAIVSDGIEGVESGDSIEIEVTIQNKGNLSATEVLVSLYEFDNLVTETTVPEILPESGKTVNMTIPIEVAGDKFVRVIVDGENLIEEVNESNNEASKIIHVGPVSMDGGILVLGSLPTTIYTGDLFKISGRGVYDIYIDSTRYTDYEVKGGSVEVTIKDMDDTVIAEYGSIQTDINGYFSKSILAPIWPAQYKAVLSVTDKTFIGEQELLFSTEDEPAEEPEPSQPPYFNDYDLTGIFQWVKDELTGVWTVEWIEPSPIGPIPESDVYLFSEDIYFSDSNPGVGEPLNIITEIHYWANRSDLLATNVPVNFFATYPGNEKVKIGELLIDSISIGAPDYGSKYVFTNWRNEGTGIYLIETEVDPSYVEENMLNNAATRALIAGEISAPEGAVSGQVSDIWGGFEGIVVELFDNTGTVLANTLTNSAGFYYFDHLSLATYQVVVSPPDGFTLNDNVRTIELTEAVLMEENFILQASLAPVANAGGPYTGEVGDIITFNASDSYDPDGTIISYEWDWDNDGNFDETFTIPTANHTWDNKFVGQVVLRVSDDDGLTSLATADITIDYNSTSPEAVILAVESAIDQLTTTNVENFKRDNYAPLLIIKLQSVIDLIDQADYSSAIDKLNKNVISKTDGCMEIGIPDTGDWIIDCDVQKVLFANLNEIKEMLQDLINEN